MIAGPSRWLADMGADGVKVEPAQDDAMRGGAPLRAGHSAYFGHHAGKRCVALDLKDRNALAAAKAIAARSDALVELRGRCARRVLTQRNFDNLCEALGHPERKADARFAQSAARAAQRR